jgi:polyisoprenoid-binding protein YceI
MKTKILTSLFVAAALFSTQLYAANYVVDTKGAHAFIQFRVQHLGYSWLYGRFDKFSGTFNYDEKNPSASKITLDIDPASVNSNHAERDKHLRSKDFLNVKKFPEAGFVSTSFDEKNDGSATLKGKLTLNGVTKAITIDVDKVGSGSDPWGGYRTGFIGTTKLSLNAFGINFNLGPKSKEVEMTLSIEGVRQ